MNRIICSIILLFACSCSCWSQNLSELNGQEYVFITIEGEVPADQVTRTSHGELKFQQVESVTSKPIVNP